jgi:hypothetical protein
MAHRTYDDGLRRVLGSERWMGPEPGHWADPGIEPQEHLRA